MKYLLFPLLFTFVTLRAQVAELTLLDATTHQPIANAEAYYLHSLNGTITNDEGKLRITVENDSLILSHIGYATKKIFTDKTFAKATLYLNPQEIQLEEVVLYDYDLKKKINYVIDNYFKLYDSKSKIFECTYREKFVKNDSIARLYQLQLDWWTKDYLFSFKKPLNDNLQIHLKSTDYAKILNLDEGINAVSSESSVILQYLHLNPYLTFLSTFAKDIQIKKVEKNTDHTIVTFDAEIDLPKKETFYLMNSVVYFDNTTNAIKRIIFTQKPFDKEDVSKRKKIPYKALNNNATWDLSFTPYKGKLMFSSFSMKMNCFIQYENKTDRVYLEQSFLRTGTQNKRIKKEDRIDVEKSFFEYITPHKQGEAKFMLTKEEEEFINKEL